MAATNWYVDPLDGDNANDGTSDAQAWATIQYAIDNLTQTTNQGDIINIKDSATITLSADLNYSSLTQSNTHPVMLRGYTSTAGDGGYALIDENGTYRFGGTSTRHNMIFQNLDVTNGGFNTKLQLGNWCTVKECRFSNMPSTIYSFITITGGTGALIENCEFSNINRYAIAVHSTGSLLVIRGNHFFDTGAYTMIGAIDLGSATGAVISHNIFNHTGTAIGINGSGTTNHAQRIFNNTFFTDGTGDAIDIARNTFCFVENNIFEGWAKAIDFANASVMPGISVSNNHFYDCTTDIDTTTYTTFMIDAGNFKSAGSSVLSKSGANTHANRLAYFEPTGDAIGGGIDGNSIGAVQLTSAGGGSTKIIRNPNMGGGIIQ